MQAVVQLMISRVRFYYTIHELIETDLTTTTKCIIKWANIYFFHISNSISLHYYIHALIYIHAIMRIMEEYFFTRFKFDFFILLHTCITIIYINHSLVFKLLRNKL